MVNKSKYIMLNSRSCPNAFVKLKRKFGNWFKVMVVDRGKVPLTSTIYSK